MIRVIIERRCEPDKGGKLEKLLIDLRSSAMLQSGYISGETLQSDDDPNYWIVISTWADKEQWLNWQATLERQKLTDAIETLLVSPEKVTIFHWAGKQVAAAED